MISTGLKSIDVLKINNAEHLVGLIDDVTKHIPEMGFYDASPVIRNQYQTLVLTQDPKVGFRKPGEFATHEAPKLDLRSVECTYLDASWTVDKAIAEQSDWGKEFVFATYTMTHLRSVFMMLARQIYYGNKSNADGFRGLFELIGSTTSDKSNADLHIDAIQFLKDAPAKKGARTADETAKSKAGLSSVFAVSTGLDSIQLAWGSEGNLTESDVQSIRVTNPEDPRNSGKWHYAQEIAGWCGLQVTSAHAFGRIHNLSEVNRLNDDMLHSLISRFPVGRTPQAFFMTRRSLEHLRESRMAFHPVGAPVANPDSVGGIPIYTTDAILNNEEAILNVEDGASGG
jgi:hypothetical protein